jgi:hypothetical protein
VFALFLAVFTQSEVAPRSTSRQIIGQELGVSGDTIRRFIRLTELIPPLLQDAEDNKIPFIPAVNISYLREPEQRALREILTEKKAKLSLAKSERLKEASAEREIDRDDILDVLDERKPKSAAIKTVKIPFKGIADAFKGVDIDETEIVRLITAIVNQHIHDYLTVGKEDDNGVSEPEAENRGGKEDVGRNDGADCPK